jgi:hypothetical protein
VATPLTPSPHRWRFGLVNAFLVVAAGAAIAAAIVVAREPKPPAGPAWPWSVPAHAADPLGAIAQHVQGEYHAAGGGPLFAIDRGELADGSQPLALAELTDAQRHVVSVYPGQTAYFKLTSRCHGAACTSDPAVRTDTAVLTRRQGLELALYTLRNISNVTNVLVVLPPAKSGGGASQALVFRRVEINSQLDRPLRLPGSATTVTAHDALTITRTTDPYTFKLSSGKVSTGSGKTQAAVIVTPP